MYEYYFLMGDKLKVFIRVITGILFVLYSHISFGAKFNAYGYSSTGEKGDIGALIKDLITDKYTNKYPYPRFALVVISGTTSTKDGRVTGYATVGVSKEIDSGKFGALVPVNRFTTSDLSDGKLSGQQRLVFEKTLIRDAVQGLMNVCNSSPSCDLGESSNQNSSSPKTSGLPQTKQCWNERITEPVLSNKEVCITSPNNLGRDCHIEPETTWVAKDVQKCSN